MSYTINWKNLDNLDQLNFIVEESTEKPVLIFRHRNSSPESIEAKALIERDWSIREDELDCYIVDVMDHKEVASEVTEIAGIPNKFPQVILFADGVTMYDESHDMINVKKIKIALKIIHRTFRWMETRV